MPIVFEDARLEPVLEKVRAGVRLSAEDGAALWESADLLALGYMANLVREGLHGAKAYFGAGGGPATGYGGAADSIARLIEVRESQDGRIATFAAAVPGASGFLDMRGVAVARLMLDNVAHIRVSMAAATPAVAQIALRFGADDLEADGGTPRDEVIRLIRAAGREPVEREGPGRPLRRHDTAFPVLT